MDFRLKILSKKYNNMIIKTVWICLMFSLIQCSKHVEYSELVMTAEGIMNTSDTGEPFSGTVKSFNEDGSLLLEGAYVEGLLQGQYTFYEQSGGVIKNQNIADLVLAGPVYKDPTTFSAYSGYVYGLYSENVLKVEGLLIKGSKEDKWTWYSSEGGIALELLYQNGHCLNAAEEKELHLLLRSDAVPDSIYGYIRTDSVYYFGNQSQPYSGMVYEFDSNGLLLFTAVYSEGELNSQYVFYDRRGKLVPTAALQSLVYDTSIKRVVNPNDGIPYTGYATLKAKDGKESKFVQGVYIKGLQEKMWQFEIVSKEYRFSAVLHFYHGNNGVPATENIVEYMAGAQYMQGTDSEGNTYLAYGNPVDGLDGPSLELDSTNRMIEYGEYLGDSKIGEWIKWDVDEGYVHYYPAAISEVDAALGSIRTQLRVYYGENGEYPTIKSGSKIVGASWNDINAGELTGKHFKDSDYSIWSSKSAYKIRCRPDPKTMNKSRTLSQDGKLAFE
jgi:antitoxin component YwqK of YwqJK toxin-antitoxin module